MKWFVSGAVSLNISELCFGRFYSFQAAGDANPVYPTQWFLCGNDAVQTRGCCIGIVLCWLFTAVVCRKQFGHENHSNSRSLQVSPLLRPDKQMYRVRQQAAEEERRIKVATVQSCSQTSRPLFVMLTRIQEAVSCWTGCPLERYQHLWWGISRPRGWKLLCCKEVLKFVQDNAT